MTLAMTSLLPLCLYSVSQASAANLLFVGEPISGKRAVFRPLRMGHTHPTRIQQQQAVSTAESVHRGRSPGNQASSWNAGFRGDQRALMSLERAGARKVVPITRGQELGFKFRPDDRASSQGQAGVSPGYSNFGGEPQSQFRPVEPRRRPTYEELYVPPPSQPVMGNPVMSYPPIPAYPPRW